MPVTWKSSTSASSAAMGIPTYPIPITTILIGIFLINKCYFVSVIISYSKNFILKNKKRLNIKFVKINAYGFFF
jgi:hypothetical protein